MERAAQVHINVSMLEENLNSLDQAFQFYSETHTASLQ